MICLFIFLHFLSSLKNARSFCNMKKHDTAIMMSPNLIPKRAHSSLKPGRVLMYIKTQKVASNNPVPFALSNTQPVLQKYSAEIIYRVIFS